MQDDADPLTRRSLQADLGAALRSDLPYADIPQGLLIRDAVTLLTATVTACAGGHTLGGALVNAGTGVALDRLKDSGAYLAETLVREGLEQSTNGTLQAWSRTALPGLAISICLALSGSITRYARGEIDGTRFLEEIGSKGSGMLASSMGSVVGQMAIPIPVLGAVIGGTVGLTLHAMFYRDSLNALREAKQARADYLRIKVQCEQARADLDAQRLLLRTSMALWLGDAEAAFQACLSRIDQAAEAGDSAAFAQAANALAAHLGGVLSIAGRDDLDALMANPNPLVL